MAFTFIPRFLVLVVLSLLVLSCVPEMCQSALIRHETHIRIINNLSPKTDLDVHCKSKDDDLGNKLIHSGESFEFKFRPSFWGSTLFFCGFRWGPNEFHWFDIYSSELPKTDDCTMCLWSVVATGPCRFDTNTGAYTQCFPWKQG